MYLQSSFIKNFIRKKFYAFILLFCALCINASFANLLNIDDEYDKSIFFVSNNETHERKFVDKNGKELLNVRGIYSSLKKICNIQTNELRYLLKSDKHIFHDEYFFGHNHYSHLNDVLYSTEGEKIEDILKIDTKYNVNYIGEWNNFVIFYVYGWGSDDIVKLLNQSVEYDKIDEEENDEDFFYHNYLVLYDISSKKNITISHWQTEYYDLLPLNDKLFVYTVSNAYNNYLKVKMIDTSGQIIKTSYYDIEDGNDKIIDSIKLRIAYRMLMDDFVSSGELVKYDIEDIVNKDIERVKSINSPLVEKEISIIKALEKCDNNKKGTKNIDYYKLSGSAYDAKHNFDKEIKGDYYRIVDDKMYVFDCEEYSDDMCLHEYNFTIYDESGKELAKNVKLCNENTLIHYGIDYAENDCLDYMQSTSEGMVEKWYNSYLLPVFVDINYYKKKNNGKYSLVSIDGSAIFDDIDDFVLDEKQNGIRRYIVKKDEHWLFLDEKENVLAKDFSINYDYNNVVKLGDDTFVLFYKDYQYDFDNTYFDSYVVDIYGKDGLVKKNLKQCNLVNDKYFNVVNVLYYGLIDKNGKWVCKFSSFDNLAFD